VELEFERTHHLMVYADDVSMLDGNMYTIKETQKLR